MLYIKLRGLMFGCALWFSVSAQTDSPAPVPLSQQASKAVPQKSITAGKFTFTYSTDDKNLNATVSCPSTGWIAVGFNPKMVMKGANIIMGSITAGKSEVDDEFGNDMFGHKPDTLLSGTNNIINGICSEQNGIVTMTFTIPLDSGDPTDVKLVPGSKVKLIFATGKTMENKKKHALTAKATITL